MKKHNKEIIFLMFLALSIVWSWSSEAQHTVTWGEDGSVTVLTHKDSILVLYSYVPTDFKDSFRMPHINFAPFFQDITGTWMDDHPGGAIVKKERDSSSPSYMKLDIFEYNPRGRGGSSKEDKYGEEDKFGLFLYGFQNVVTGDGFSGYREDAFVAPYASGSDVWGNQLSTDMKAAALGAQVPMPAECAWRTNVVSHFARSASAVALMDSLSQHYPTRSSETGGVVFFTSRTYAALQDALIERDEVAAERLYERVFVDTTYPHIYCQRYTEAFQPIIMRLTMKDVTIKSFKIAGVAGAITPAAIFATHSGRRWDDPDFSHLFGNRRPVVAIAAHRGYWRKTGVAQNSIAALTQAEHKSDADLVELDVRSTKDSVPICFHDDKPQKILLEAATTFPHKSVYDLDWATLKDFYLYDRHGNKTTEKLLNLDAAFEYYSKQNFRKSINLDIGIPAQVPQDGKLVAGQPFFDAIFLKAIGLAAKYRITDRVIFKGKYTYANPIWEQVKDTLRKYIAAHESQFSFNPIIAYTPKFGDDTGLGTANPAAYREAYLADWIDPLKALDRPFVSVVGMEVRLKNDDINPVNEQLKRAIPEIQKRHYDENTFLKVGIFSETPTTCQGYWTKSANERYVDFSIDKRNNFDWVINKGYDYIITDFPNILRRLRDAKFSNYTN